MPAIIDNIASWEEECLLPEAHLAGQDSIATESQQKESPVWEICIDALLKIWEDSSAICDPQPNRQAIEAATRWVDVLRRRFPGAPPTCIIPEPEGGIIVERRQRLPNGQEVLCELTFYNDARAERTDYLDGHVLHMSSIPWRPLPRKTI